MLNEMIDMPKLIRRFAKVCADFLVRITTKSAKAAAQGDGH
jgi:hypothetical protein